MNPEAAAKWCKQHNAQPEQCLVFTLPDTKWTDVQLRKVAESLPVVGRGFVLDSIMDTAEHKTLALLEWRNPLVREQIPQSVSGPGENVVHVIFPERCTTSPTEEIPGDTASPSTTEVEVSLPSNAIGPEVLNALGSLVEKCLKPTQPFTGFGYRKLRFFSGKQPTPQGEEDFESWMDQASQAVEEWDIPETQKKQRIAESLKGLAADTIRNLKMSKYDCTAKDYLEVLHDVFGRTEKASDLLYQFEHTYQEVGEKLSDYINRLDKILHQIILKKGVDPKVADQVRIGQILQGAQAMDPIMWKLRMRDRRETLTYSQLVKEVREEEALLEAKSQTSTQAASGSKPELATVHTTQTGVMVPSVVSTEVSQLQAQVSTLTEAITQVTRSVAELQKIVVVLAEGKDTPAKASTVRPKGESAKPRSIAISGFCFRCGETGHMKRQCPNAENLRKVNELLLASAMQENFRGPQ
ncbi:paraneoplastic antigen Ma2 homolog [Xenopus tropicalis]|uniref:Paraneoplastic antigen Ma2 homolog n=1 Tax=Xenopus tropicalis TaxID=8364 RepID=A0A8J1J881_XENTR|nr:paraneoplastic antigen Ma2 homolog [Xenopus tropicalis]